jgi:methanethiol S-methyltransferase
MPVTASARSKIIAVTHGVLCHGLFAVAIAVMIYEMYFGLSRAWGRVPTPWNWIANGALLLQFPLGHSLLLTRRGRALLGGTLATTRYVIVASVQVLLLYIAWSPSGTIWWQASGAAAIVLTMLYAAGWLLLLKAMFDAGIEVQTGSLGWRAMLRNRKPVFPPMPTRGLFRIVRQPIYVSFAITVWTVPRWTPDQLVLACVLTAYCVVGPLFKEARFSRRFGREFAVYKAAHPYWLPIPRWLSGRLSGS